MRSPKQAAGLTLSLPLLLSLLVNSTSAATTIEAKNATTSIGADKLDASPSVTSVHQVWTSTSSGQVDELSPELIGKLRRNVPFLAAYALRPRLVGATAGNANEIGAKLSAAASAPKSARQSLDLPLNDFDEFRVHTSSISKSEHRQQRNTSLRRRVDKQNRSGQNRKRTRKGAKITKRRSKAKSSKQKRRRKQLATRQRREKHPGGNSRLRSGKFQVEEAKGGQPAGEANGLDMEMKSIGTTTATMMKLDPTTKSTEANDDNETEPDVILDDEPRAEPRRVGDGDVDEDGDTVLIQPKSDGVDDDPEIPTDEQPADEPTDDEAEDDDEENETDGSAEDKQVGGNDIGQDERGKRVHRDKPNTPIPMDQALGGGVGATFGGGGDGERGRDGHGDGDGDESDQVDGRDAATDVNRDNNPNDRRPGSGVEFASDDESGRDVGASGDGASDGSERTPGSDGSQFGDRRKDGGSGDRRDGPTATPSGGRDGQANRPAIGGGDGEDAGGDVDDDLDYRDEIDARDKRRRTEPKPADGQTKGQGNGAQDCDTHDDGSYKPHDEKYHHDHHQKIDWLRKSIPGEPGDDYPILSLGGGSNATKFKCSDQKLPGYYADVEARCQIFHICQADGRQDSFLCPNGTIFSQKTFVCVWWNGFDCEDAPKLYHLNALLYKSTDGRDSPQSAVLWNSMSKSTGTELEDDRMPSRSSIDSLIKTMRRRQNTDDDDDEADGDDGESAAELRQRNYRPLDSSRLVKAKAIPRRRRASVRQAPPKLKARRSSRRNPKRKLRHGTKPRRRA